MKSSLEIHKLTVMLSTYLSDNKFFEETSHTNWTNLDEYRNKMSQRTQLVNQHPFEIEYMQNIMQQECNSLNCGVFVAEYAEYLSEGMNTPSVGFEEEYHRMRYTSLLRNYGLRKAKKCYVSDNDDSPRLRIKILPLSDESGIFSIK
ncbi:hypothetical protein CQW23_21489 [Capsicum baccatum]|uniref:Ubiquitin-like protease family profile domain-containing protein n=1 Tax=Capsicum baccatum TaxID=33114 RepID=A0A2G2VY61_CAPBA|nr:hypothetical protein CQW23_21489 [Capsicum baccatum]